MQDFANEHRNNCPVFIFRFIWDPLVFQSHIFHLVIQSLNCEVLTTGFSLEIHLVSRLTSHNQFYMSLLKLCIIGTSVTVLTFSVNLSITLIIRFFFYFCLARDSCWLKFYLSCIRNIKGQNLLHLEEKAILSPSFGGLNYVYANKYTYLVPIEGICCFVIIQH